MDCIKTGVIGVGHLGQHHAKWFSQLPQSELVGVYDIDKPKAVKLAEEYGVISFDSVDDLAQAVDAVSIVVPTSEHFEVASLFIKRGVDCLIEKPITATLEEAVRLKKLANEKQVTVTVGLIERFNPAVRALEKQEVQPSFIEAHRLTPFGSRGTDVAVVLDLMIHDIDLSLMLIRSEVVDIQASAVAVISDQADIANARLTFANGAVANLTASRISLKPMRKIRLFQQSGYYSLDLSQKQADIYSLATADDTRDGIRVPLGNSGRQILYQKCGDDGTDMLQSELSAFLDATANGQPVRVTLDEAIEGLRVALEIERIGIESIAQILTSGK